MANHHSGIIQAKVSSKIGELYLVASAQGLQGVCWEEQIINCENKKSFSDADRASQNLHKAASQISEYLEGRRTDFDLPLDIRGTPFQKMVWRELAKLKYGEIISYSELARRIKNEKAVRAVGTANGKNLLCIIIPCHRVIASDGSLGGYSGGLEIKSTLLQIETSQNS